MTSNKVVKGSFKSLQDLGETFGISPNQKLVEGVNFAKGGKVLNDSIIIIDESHHVKEVEGDDVMEFVELSETTEYTVKVGSNVVTLPLHHEESKIDVPDVEIEEGSIDDDIDSPLDVLIGREDGSTVTVDQYIDEIFGVKNDEPMTPETLELVDDIISKQIEAAKTVEEASADRPKVREETLTELRAMYGLLKIPYLETSWGLMTDIQLQEQLYLVKSCSGGTITMATLIKQTEDDYNRLVNSDAMKSRMKLLEQKAADQAKMIQTFTKMFGNDVVIQGAKSKDYHDMLKSAVSYIVSLTGHVNMIAEQLGITLPVEEYMPNGKHVPITENTPADPRVYMYVLNVFRSHLDKLDIQANNLNKQNSDNQKYIKRLEQHVKLLKDQQESTNREIERERTEFLRRLGNSSYCIIKDAKGNILRKIDNEKPLTHPNDLDLRGTINTALFLTSERAAENLAERLMSTRRFRNREFSVFNVSIVKQS